MFEFLNFITTLMTNYGDYSVHLWCIVAVFFLLLEIGSPGLFFFISLALGCLCAAGSALLNHTWSTQFVTSIIGTLISFLIFNRTIANKRSSHAKTNIHALIGQEGIVIVSIEPRHIGRVKIKGEEWPAMADNHVILQKGTVVKIIRIDGNKLIVI